MTTQIYIGTYSRPIVFGTGDILDGKGKGIYRLALDTEAKTLALDAVYDGIANPSYLTLSHDKRYLYAVNELKEYDGSKGGSVSAFAIEKEGLRLINILPTHGEDPCHVAIGNNNQNLYVANYSSGSAAVYQLAKNGGLASLLQLVQHTGHSANKERQEGPHAHSTVFSPDGHKAFIADLGIDKLMSYTAAQDGTLTENTGQSFKAQPGQGPRHCVFSKNGRFCYLINELDSSISVLEYNQQDGSFTQLQHISTLPPNTSKALNSSADIHLSPDGKFLYGSNRGHDSISAYKVDTQSGRLSFKDCYSSMGKTPRSFNITPSGNFLICANQDSDNIVCFQIAADGELQYKSQLHIPTPVCVCF